MPAEKETNLDHPRWEGSTEIEVLLTQIEGEKIPERLLTLAQELQNALNLRKKRLSVAGKH